MRKRKATHLIIVLCVCSVITAGCAILQAGEEVTPGPGMSARVLDASAFREDWVLCMGPWPPPDRAAGERGESDSLYVQFCHDAEECRDFGAEQGLFLYRDEAAANAAFDRDFSLREFPDLGTSMLTGWNVPDEWAYQSRVADELEFACAEVDIDRVGPPEWRCKCVARYAQYISTLNSVLSPQCMSLRDLAQVLEAIDARMALQSGNRPE